MRAGSPGRRGRHHWNTFEKWDAKLIRWLEREGRQVDFCTDWDLDREPALLSTYRMLLSVGHDEYWSTRMRDHTEAFVAQSGNLAFLGGNTCYWRVDVQDGSVLACSKHDLAYRWDDADFAAPQKPAADAKPEPTMPSPAPAFGHPTGALELDKLDLSFNPDRPAFDDPTPSVLDGQWHDAATKLDLAKAYQEMGDTDGAREILQEVLHEGDDQQKSEAQGLLAKLAS